MNEQSKLFKPCNYTEWPDILKEHSFPTVVVELEPGEAKIFALNFEYAGDGKKPEGYDEHIRSHLHTLKPKIGLALAHFEKGYDKGCYVKMNSRGAKDSYYGYKHGFMCNTLEDVMRLFSDSERIFEDVTGLMTGEPSTTMLFREWFDIPAYQEWRCFHCHGQLIAMSQYDYRSYYASLQSERIKEHVWDIAKEAHGVLCEGFPEPVVFDLWITDDSEWKLIEINPWLPSQFGTDPCLIDWKVMESIRTLPPKDEYEGVAKIKNNES
jgi:hypothetical protein